jgi:hypothetical protein
MTRSPPYSARRSTSENRFLASATVMVTIGHHGLFGYPGQRISAHGVGAGGRSQDTQYVECNYSTQ